MFQDGVLGAGDDWPAVFHTPEAKAAETDIVSPGKWLAASCR